MLRCAGLLLAGLLFVPTTPPASSQDAAVSIEAVPRAIEELLEDYGRAFQTRDRALLASTLTGEGLAASELRGFDNAAEVPLERFVVRANTQFSGDLASARIRSRYPELEVRVYHVIEESTLVGEAGPSVDDGAFTFVRTDGGDPYDGWRLASKSDTDDLAFFSPVHIWDGGPVAVRRSDRFLLLTHPSAVDEVQPMLEIAERAMDQAASFWPEETSDRYTIIVPTRTQELAELIHTTLDLNKFVAFASAGAFRDRGWTPAYPRLYVHLDHMRNYGNDAQVEILAHELIHAITRPVSGPHMPIWVEEGLANVGGGSGGRASRARDGPLPDDFPTDDQFVTGAVSEIQRRYDLGQVAIETAIDAHGIEAVARFYAELGSARVVPGTDTYHVARAAESALGWTGQEWVAAWRQRLSR